MTTANHPCLTRAWRETHGELLAWLRHRLAGDADADDLLQEIFIKALQQGNHFCSLDNPRAWLFQVARHALIDRYRGQRIAVDLPEDLPANEPEHPQPIDILCHCLPRVLTELSSKDRLAIELCDIQGQPQLELAKQLGLSLPGAKSRLQRARQRLKAQLESACQVRYDEDGQVAGFTPRPPLSPGGTEGEK